MKCFVQLGKIGDILGILPILYHEHKTTNQKQVLFTSKEYSFILEGCSYILPSIFDGEWQDLRGAIKKAKQQFEEVYIPQTHGRDFDIQHRTSSFQLDAWLRCGCVEHFEDWPLVIDQRNGRRERTLIGSVLKRLTTQGRPYEKFILFADQSESSPFQQKEELAELLKMHIPATHRIIRLSEVRAENPIDLLALYDRAACLVTIETMHIHLSKASNVPTVVLAADGWRGSAKHRKFRFYCKYQEWPQNKNVLMEAVKDAITGITPTETTDINDKVSAIIPIFKPDVNMLNRCLQAVLPQVDEVILTGESGTSLPIGTLAIDKIRHVVHAESGIGFSKNVNFGVKHATKELILILNDDVYLAPDAVEKMKWVMYKDVAAVGHLLRYPNGTIYCGGKKFGGPNGGLVDYHQTNPSITTPTEMDDICGASMLVRKKVFRELGGFDEQIKFYLSDDDFAKKLTQSKWRIMYTPFATGIHDGHQETKHAPFNVMEEQKKAQAIFTERWREK